MQEFNNEKNIKLLILSATILVGLFIYIILKQHLEQNDYKYLYGLVFLSILFTVSLILKKIQKKISNDKNEKIKIDNNTQKDSSILPIKTDITFDDIAGIDKVKNELKEIVDFLNNPKKFLKFGISLPKGVILSGPPGVGKTMLAKAMAGTANVAFFYHSGASFVELYVGAGAKRVRELFSIAKANAPAIIFIDEIDAIGKKRGMGSNDEREATLNELLTQMDGFEANDGILVVAATNKIEVLDEALLRSGRFDRRVFVNLPNFNDRLKIIKHYLNGKKYDFSIELLAKNTAGFNSAALFTIINEALINMVKENRKVLIQKDIDFASKKVQFGMKDFNLLCADELDILATYQATKSFITKTNLSLFDEGVKIEERNYLSKTKLVEQIKSNLSGFIGLEILKGEGYIVFESELKRAYLIADKAEKDYRLSNSKEMIDKAKDELKQIIIQNKDEILKLKDLLLKQEYIDVF